MRALALTCCFLTLQAAGASAQSAHSDIEPLAHEYLECAAYFSLAANVMEKKGEQDLKREYERLSHELVKRGEVLVTAQRKPIQVAAGMFDAYLRSTVAALNKDAESTINNFERQCHGPLE
ncbi:hypothetical protein V3589_25375 [Sinorhizobium fredii]|uniref:hypothetical protein n=1 Tax=Rhizobium fredii TaxID=380 RepID=UPI00309E0315